MTKLYKNLRIICIFWTLFIGIGALGGSMCMIIDTSGKFMGMDAMLPCFQVLPFADVLFQNFLFSGIMLLIVNGLTNLTAAAFLFAKKKVGIILTAVFGFTLMLWIVIQFIIFEFNFMSTAYFIFGFLQLVTGFWCYATYSQDTFSFNKDDYKNISEKSDTIVVFFSRKLHTASIAYKIADELKAEIYEIKSTELTKGIKGFWWCGRFAMHGWGMPIEKTEIDFSKYEKVIIVSPIWVFNVCAPIRQFCIEQSGKIKNAEYVLNRFAFFNKKSCPDFLDSTLKTKGKLKAVYSSKLKNIKVKTQYTD